MEQQRNQVGITRRGALGGAASVGLALPVLAACGDDEPEQVSDPSPAAESSESQEAPETPESSEPATREPAPGIVSASEVPVGGGVVLAQQKVVVTQPSKGEFKGFTAVCTHQGCLVSGVTDTIDCSCHGSAYSIEDGSVVGGPAPAPLAEQQLVVRDDSINLA